MRTIRFRAWNSRRSEMIMLDDLTGANWDVKFIFKRYAIMQYTGLKDKNGVEIYEGDIVQVYAPDASGYLSKHNQRVIKWDGDHVFRVGFNIGRGRKANQGDHLKYSEVIGNIYENPELIKDAA